MIFIYFWKIEIFETKWYCDLFPPRSMSHTQLTMTHITNTDTNPIINMNIFSYSNLVKIQIMECIAGCFGSKSPNRSRNHRKNLNSARNDVEPRPANASSSSHHRSHLSTSNQTGVSNKSRPFTTKRTYIDDSEKSDTPLLSRLSDLTDESDLSDPIGFYPNTSKQGTQYKKPARVRRTLLVDVRQILTCRLVCE